ncbi:MAG: nucleotidyltransferase family protein [Verrucomicrobiia bacterium]
MNALILAAGYATRLYPLTLNQSKCLLNIAGKPMIDYVVEKLTPLEEIDKIYIVSNEKFYNHFHDWLSSRKPSCRNVPIEIVNDGSTDESNKLGAIGDICFVINKKNPDSDLLVIAGDNFLTDTLVDFVRFSRKKNAPVLAVYDLKTLKNVSKYSCVTIDSDGRLIEFEEKPENPKTSMIGIALYYYPAHILPLFEKYKQEQKHCDQPGRFIQWLYKREPVYAKEISGVWFDIGDSEVLQQAEQYVKENL